jgi:hypothetical protein
MIVGSLIMLCGYVLDVYVKTPSGLSVLEQRLEVVERDLAQLRASVAIKK